MDGENNGNPLNMDDLGGKPTIFGNIHILTAIIQQLGLASYQPGDEVQLRQALLDWLDVWARRRESKRRGSLEGEVPKVSLLFFGICLKICQKMWDTFYWRTGKIST